MQCHCSVLFSRLPGKWNARGSGVWIEPFIVIARTYFGFSWRMHTTKGQSCLVGWIKTLYLDISSQNTIHENILKLYVYIFNCYLNKDHSTSCKNNDNHANDQGNVILKMNIHLRNNSNFNYFLFIEKGKCVSHQLCLPLLIFLLFFLQLFCWLKGIQFIFFFLWNIH